MCSKKNNKLACHAPEEGHGGAAEEGAVGNVVLVGQVLGGLDGRGHPLHGEEGGQVGRVRGDDDEGEEPPDPAHNPGRGRLRIEVRTLERGEKEKNE